jgi:hypothetical protein
VCGWSAAIIALLVVVEEGEEGKEGRLRSVETGLIAYQMFRAALDFLGTLYFVDCGLGPADLAVLYSKA